MENALIHAPDGTYSIDFDDFEKKASNPRTRLFLLCNPHNPTGRSWTRDELERMAEICLRHSIVIVSEVHPGEFLFMSQLASEKARCSLIHRNNY